MGIEVRWDNTDRFPPHSILRWTFSGQWTWQEFLDADDFAYGTMSGQTHIVHSIVDFSQSAGLPDSRALTYFNRSIRRPAPNRGLICLMGLSIVLRGLESILRLMNPRVSDAYVVVTTVEQAYLTIQRRYPDSVHRLQS